MATYKVIQDIEAEDKLLGPLTLKQFIYAGVTVVCLYLCFLSISKHVTFLVVIFLPPALVLGFFAWPWNLNQTTEIWALAKIRFLLKPHRRIWDQSGVKQLVTITAPKKTEYNASNGLSQIEVHSRLKALADTIDSRGWAVKDVNVNLYSQPAPAILSASDRLIDVGALPHEVPTIDVQASDDILDEHSNLVAQHFDAMISAADQTHKQQIQQQLRQATDASNQKPANASSTPPNDYWFMNQTPASTVPNYVTFNSQVVAPGSDGSTLPVLPSDPTNEEEALVKQLKAGRSEPSLYNAHLRTIQPLDKRHQTVQKSDKTISNPATNATPAKPMTEVSDPAILELANNNDLNVATLARQANRKSTTSGGQDEVIVTLH